MFRLKIAGEHVMRMIVNEEEGIMKKVSLVLVALAMVFAYPLVSHAFFIDFENGFGRDGQSIDDIAGVTFEVTGGYDWIYGDSTTGNWNTRSIDKAYGSGNYQHYGDVFAFLGTDNNAGAGKIDFTNDDGTWFKTGYTSYSNFYVEGYDSDGNLIASASGGANLDGADMGWLMITAPVGETFDYVIVHDTGNYFLVDNMSGDTTGVNPVPEPATMLLVGCGLLGVSVLRRRFVK